MSKLDELTEELQAIDRKLRNEGEQIVKDLFKSLFDELPKLEAVRWTQYTPYFNDGDPCVFGVHEPEFKIDDPSLDDGSRYYEDDNDHYHWGDSDYPWIAAWDTKEITEWQPLRDFNKLFCSDTLEKIFLYTFGDHSEILVDRSGFTVEEKCHD